MKERRSFDVMGRCLRVTMLGAFVIACSARPLIAQWQPASIWSDVLESSIGVQRSRPVERARTVSLNVIALKQVLAAAPLEFTADARTRNIELALPLPDGTNGRFLISESPIMEPGLAAQLPETKTYRGQCIDDPATTTRFSWTPAGFRAIVLSPRGASAIEPFAAGDNLHYISYYASDFNQALADMKCETNTADAAVSSSPLSTQFISGSQLRTYRLALAATGEFTRQYGGGNPTTALNNTIIPLVNGINAVYEKEATIRFTLVAGELTIVFTDSLTDPYDNSNQGTMLTQDQAALDAAIGSANYDIGHALGGIWLGPGSFSGAGIASLGVVCNSTLKARGATRMGGGSGSEVIFVSLIAHEWGHQFNAPHTFNGLTGNCNGQRSSTDAYEPGSGSTLMGYTTCGVENLEPYTLSTFPLTFHTGSLTRIITYADAFGTCATLSATGNTPPTIAALANFTVPQQTPFTLTASASDVNGDALTYSWEEYDLGAASPPNTDDGTRPIFRVYLPSATGNVRTFPSLTYILNNANTPPATYVVGSTTYTTGEALATTNRTLNFHVTVRDNRAGGGGVQDAAMQVAVTTGSGPFNVTVPNTALTWDGFSQQTITWNVANTTAAPVSCANVKISLSTDGGSTFPTIITASTPNDGSELLTIPNAASTTTAARIKVEAVGNIFFDVSDVNFTLNHVVPIQLASFSGTVTGNSVKLDWSTASETNNYGFFAERRASSQSAFTELPGSFRAGNGTTGSPHNYTFTDPSAPVGTMFYRLRQVDLDNTIHFSDPIQVSVVTSVAEAAPKVFSLGQNYPNPFNPTTALQFTIVNQQSTIVKLYDLLGREVATLVNEVKQPGTYTVHFDGTGLASGVYVYRLTAGPFTQSRTMVLMK